MGRGLIALLSAGVVLVASAYAHSDQVVRARSVLATHRLPDNTVKTFTVACRRGYVAASAGVSNPAPRVNLLAIRPVGVRAYRFRFGNPADNGPQRVTVALACRSLAPAGQSSYSLRLTTIKEQVVAQARKFVAASLTCPPGMVPAGGAAELDQSRQRALQAYPGAVRLSLRRQTSTLSSFSFAAQNESPRAHRVAFYGGCLTLARSAGAPRRRLHVNVSTFRVQVRPGSQTLNRRCAPGWFSLAAGYELRSKLTQIAGAAVLGAGGRWSLTSDAAQATTADLQLACAKLGP
jgi:hypothetical protein